MRLTDWQHEIEAYLLGDQANPSAALRDSVLGSPALSAEEGLAIYYNAYRSRLLQVLRDDYPALATWMGEEAFEHLANGYLHVHPSRHFSLRWLGAHLADYIQRNCAQTLHAEYAELARLEWAFTLAFDAFEGSPMTLQHMATVPASDWPALHFSLVPSVQWLIFHFNSVAIWQAFKSEQTLPISQALGAPQVCLVWRNEHITHYRNLSDAEANALHGLSHCGWSFAQLCAELRVLKDGAPLQAATWLKQWINEGLLSREQLNSVTG